MAGYATIKNAPPVQSPVQTRRCALVIWQGNKKEFLTFVEFWRSRNQTRSSHLVVREQFLLQADPGLGLARFRLFEAEFFQHCCHFRVAHLSTKLWEKCAGNYWMWSVDFPVNGLWHSQFIVRSSRIYSYELFLALPWRNFEIGGW